MGRCVTNIVARHLLICLHDLLLISSTTHDLFGVALGAFNHGRGLAKHRCFAFLHTTRWLLLLLLLLVLKVVRLFRSDCWHWRLFTSNWNFLNHSKAIGSLLEIEFFHLLLLLLLILIDLSLLEWSFWGLGQVSLSISIFSEQSFIFLKLSAYFLQFNCCECVRNSFDFISIKLIFIRSHFQRKLLLEN